MALTSALCASPLKAEVIRVTRLDACGSPVTGSSNALGVFDAFTEVQNSPQYEEGQRYLQKKANGNPCVNQKDPSFLNWIEQTVNLCTLDPRIMAMVTGNSILATGVGQGLTATSGTGVYVDDSLLDQHFSLELWTPIAGNGNCSATGQLWFYWAFPNMFDAKIQDFTFQNDVFTMGWTATSAPMYVVPGSTVSWWSKMDGALTGNVPMGEYSPDPSNVVTFASQNVHYFWGISATPPPTPACGTYSLPLA